jgi:uncharacterized protein
VKEQFLDAIRSGDETTVASLLENDSDLASARDPHGVSALLTALYYRQHRVADIILRHHSSPLDIFEAAALGRSPEVAEKLDSQPALVTAYSPDGWPALHLAAYFGSTESVKILLDRGAGIDMLSTNMGNTALQAAVANDQTDVVRLLIDRGAEVDYAMAQGEHTALHSAVLGGNVEIVRMLLEAGADPSTRSTTGKTPRDLAEANHPELVPLLDEHRSQRGGGR